MITYIWIVAFALFAALTLWSAVLVSNREDGMAQAILAGYCMIIGILALIGDGILRLIF